MWMGWYRNFLIEAQACAPYDGFRLRLSLCGHDNAISLVASLPKLLFLSVGLESWPIKKFLGRFTKRKDGWSDERDIGVAFHDGILWVSIWEDPMCSNSNDPKWWKFHINVEDWIKGKCKYTEEIVETREILVPMPEKSYPATAIRKIQRWSRPRWKAEERMSVSINIPNGGIPHEGKGENSWDCGKDATHGMSCPAQSIPEAVGRLVGFVLTVRVEHGGWNDWEWKKD